MARATPPKIVGSGVAAAIPPKARSGRPTVACVPVTVSDGRYDTRPCFSHSWVEHDAVKDAVDVARYMVDGVPVRIANREARSHGEYIFDPPEYRLPPRQLQILGETSDDISDAVPSDVELNSLWMLRPYIKSRAKDLVYKRLVMSADEGGDAKDIDRESDFLADLLCRYTAGYGALEILLKDPNVQDIYVDAPSSQTPVEVVLRSEVGGAVRQKCRTNLYVGARDLASLVSRVKFETGRPFSEACPVLEADMHRLGARITIVGPPLSDKGLSVAIRKHSPAAWTMPALVANGSLSPLLSSFLWACVVGRRTVLVAGSRGAGKTTLLGAMMMEFPLSQRIVVIEDTPEIPLRRLQEIGYDLSSLRFSSDGPDDRGSARDALRVSLRMGESAIVIGEVRGEEAKVLYESMRAGSAGSSVLGTIHGNSAKGVLDRAVEDLGVSERAFSSTDIIVVIGLMRSPDGATFTRRVTQVAEVREVDGRVALVDLFDTDPGCLCAKPTSEFSPRCKSIVGIADALGVRPEAVMDIVKTRAHADQLMAEAKDGPRCSDSARVESNEFLAQALFTPEGPESGLERWRRWYDGRRTV